MFHYMACSKPITKTQILTQTTTAKILPLTSLKKQLLN